MSKYSFASEDDIEDIKYNLGLMYNMQPLDILILLEIVGLKVYKGGR